MLNIVLAIDERLDDIKRCVDSLNKVYPNEEIALATYGSVEVPEQPKVKDYAASMGFQYFDAPRQSYIPQEKEWHCSETLARIQITKHFSSLGHYEQIYIMHSDVVIKGDFREYFNNLMYDNKWSFIGFLLRAEESFDSLKKKGSWALRLENNKARFADILTIYNPLFVFELYKEYGNDGGIWEGLLSKFTLWGDLAQFDLAREWHGYDGRCIKEHKNRYTGFCGGLVEHLERGRFPGFIPSGEISLNRLEEICNERR